MPLILKNFANNDSISGVWEIIENEEFLIKNVSLFDFEIEKLSRMKSDKRRIEFLAIRILVKSLQLNLKIEYNENGKPVINNGKISISHSGKYAAFIYNPRISCSIDIEKISEKLIKNGNIVFDNNELSLANNNPFLLTLFWSCKECIYKIADNTQANFKDNILVRSINQSNIILASFENDSISKIYELNYLQLDSYVLVWALDPS